ncbi:MAG: hypothetical protein AAF756_01040 [Pseudomonadota bacterium]
MHSNRDSMKSAFASSVATALLICVSVFSASRFEPVFEPFGRDLPAFTLFVMDSHKYWLLVPIASLAFLAFARLRESRLAYRAVQVLLLTAVLSIPLALFGIYSPILAT